MSTTQNLKMGLIAVAGNLLLSLNAVAAPMPMPADPNMMRMEAGGGCSSGNCFHPSDDTGLNGVEAQVHKVNIFDAKGKDPRWVQSTTGEGAMFAPIGRVIPKQAIPFKGQDGRLSMHKDLWGTGFLASPCLLVTNYHVVFGDSNQPNQNDFAVNFKTSVGTVSGKPILWGPKNSSGKLSDDWAVVELDQGQCVGKEIGWLLPDNSAEVVGENQPVTLAGYAFENMNGYRQDQLLRSPNGLATRSDERIGDGAFLHSVSMTLGQSGSPVGRIIDGRFKVAGVNLAQYNPTGEIKRKYNEKDANVALNYNSILAKGALRLLVADLKKNKGVANRLAAASL